MLTWTEGRCEDGSKWIKAKANGRDAYIAELMSDGRWALFRKWTGHLVVNDGAAWAISGDVKAIKAKAEEDLRRWRDLLDELTAPF